MRSLSLLEDLRELPVGDAAAGYTHSDAPSRLRSMDGDNFALGVAVATEEALSALFQARNVPDVLDEAYRLAFSNESQDSSLAEYFQEIQGRGERSVAGFVSSLKGKAAELESVSLLEERFPGYHFEVAANPNQPVYDLIGSGPEGTEDVLVQVKAGGLGYVGDVLERMEEAPEDVYFAVSSELYSRILELTPDAADQLVDSGIEIIEYTDDIIKGLGILADNLGVDVPDALGEALPYVGDVVLGIRLIGQIISTESELGDVEISGRARVHGIRTLMLMTRFGVTQVCTLAGGAAGTAANPGIGTAAGAVVGAGGALLLNRLLESRIEEVAMMLMGEERDEVFYLMNKAAIDGIGASLAGTTVG